MLLQDLLGPRERARHAARRRRQLELGAQQKQHLAPLDRHALRHAQNQLVAARRRNEGKRNAGVAAGRLDDQRARLELAGLFKRIDHRRRRCGL